MPTVARLALPLLVCRVLAADDPNDPVPLDNLARVAALFDRSLDLHPLPLVGATFTAIAVSGPLSP